MSSTQSLKAAIIGRVDPVLAMKLFDESRNLGNSQMCPSGALNIDVDEFGRPQGGAGHRMLRTDDAACSGSFYPARLRIKHENSERPIIGPCSPGNRGAGDFLYGSVRDRFPENIYGEGKRGSFMSIYGASLNPKDNSIPVNLTIPSNSKQNTSFSHDAVISPYVG